MSGWTLNTHTTMIDTQYPYNKLLSKAVQNFLVKTKRLKSVLQLTWNQDNSLQSDAILFSFSMAMFSS